MSTHGFQPPAPGREAPAAPAQPTQAPPPSAGESPPPGGGFGGASILLLLLPLLLVVFMMRNQTKRQKELEAKLKAGDRVITQSGLIGRIIEVGDRTVKLEIAPGVNVQWLKSSISGHDAGTEAKPEGKKEPAKEPAKDKK